jgi:mono/diheme cytochrome c family protein
VRIAVASVVFLLVLVSAGLRASVQTQDAAVTYSEEQAARGEQVYKTVCVDCHARKELSNADFRVKWNGRSAFDLFERIRSTMPESNPGGLPRAQYLDATAFIAKLNGLAAGTVELPDDEAMLKKQLLPLPPPTHVGPTRPAR